MSCDSNGPTAFQIFVIFILAVFVGPVLETVASLWGGMDQDLTPAAIVLVIGLGFHVINARSNGPFSFLFHITQFVRTVVIAEILFVAIKFIDRLF